MTTVSDDCEWCLYHKRTLNYFSVRHNYVLAIMLLQWHPKCGITFTIVMTIVNMLIVQATVPMITWSCLSSMILVKQKFFKCAVFGQSIGKLVAKAKYFNEVATDQKRPINKNIIFLLKLNCWTIAISCSVSLSLSLSHSLSQTNTHAHTHSLSLTLSLSKRKLKFLKTACNKTD